MSDQIKRLDIQIMALSELLNRIEVVVLDKQEQPIFVDAMAQPMFNEDVQKTQSAELQRRKFAEEAVLNLFHYETMSDRYENVAEAHVQTFKWVLDESSDELGLWDNFVEWLRSGSDIYWIHGKAASGKSTLMKFIYDNPKTMQLLASRSPGVKKAGFFFWNSGNRDQRSHNGLLRSLIFETLSRHRALIPIVFPSQWSQNYSQASYNPMQQMQVPQSQAELTKIFQQIIDQDISPLNLCLFIDRLDEYDDNKRKIANFVVQLSKSPKVKLCISSRPLLELEDAFSGYPSLRLQDLTSGDIQNYVFDHVLANNRYHLLTLQEPVKARELVEEIVDKADGVFLWVRLVVESLLDGLGNRDTISDLQTRLNIIPSDLKDLYSYMLSCIPKFYFRHTFRLFQIMLAVQAVESMGLYTYSPKPMTVLLLSFATDKESKLAIPPDMQPLSGSEIETRCRLMADRLKVHSAGLLEIPAFVRFYNDDYDGNYNRAVHKANAKVQYLHRTARDYFGDNVSWPQHLEDSKLSHFCPHTALIRSHLLSLKLSPWEDYDSSIIHAKTALHHAYLADTSKGELDTSLLDELDKTMTIINDNSSAEPDQKHWTDAGRSTDQNAFLSTAVSYGLYTYIRGKLSKSASSIVNSKKGRPLLDYAFGPKASEDQGRCSVEMVELLLQCGAKPNQKYKNSTVWEGILFSPRRCTMGNSSLKGGDGQVEMLKQRLRILQLLIQYGADPTLVERAERGREGRTAIYAITEEFSEMLPEETASLVALLREKGMKSRKGAGRRFSSRLWIWK